MRKEDVWNSSHFQYGMYHACRHQDLLCDLEHVPGPKPCYLLKIDSPTWTILEAAMDNGQFDAEMRNGSLKLYGEKNATKVAIPKEVYDDLVVFIKDTTAKAHQFMAHDSERVLMYTFANRTLNQLEAPKHE